MIRYLDTTSGTGHNVNHVVESQMFKSLNRLDILQGQLIQQRSGLEMDQRPWIKFEPGGERPKDTEPKR